MNAKQGHTTTPWEVAERVLVGGMSDIDQVVVRDSRNQEIARFENYGGDGFANAKIAVHAVNSFELLKSALRSIINSCPVTKEFDDIVAIAEKALSHAEVNL